jgi:hypothetical protein
MALEYMLAGDYEIDDCADALAQVLGAPSKTERGGFGFVDPLVIVSLAVEHKTDASDLGIRVTARVLFRVRDKNAALEAGNKVVDAVGTVLECVPGDMALLYNWDATLMIRREGAVIVYGDAEPSSFWNVGDRRARLRQDDALVMGPRRRL